MLFLIIDAHACQGPCTWSPARVDHHAARCLLALRYELRPDTAYVSKTIALTDTTGTNLTREVNSVTAIDGVDLQLNGKVPDATHTSSNVQFNSCADPHASTTSTVGVFVTAQNSFVVPPSLTWQPDQNWTTRSAGGDPAARVLDSAIIGLYSGSTSQLEFAEAAAVTKVVEQYLVAPSEDNATVKINIAWCGKDLDTSLGRPEAGLSTIITRVWRVGLICSRRLWQMFRAENDYQLDISLPEDRESYKRIIDRAAEMGLSHILFAPRNSDVSSMQNNTARIRHVPWPSHNAPSLTSLADHGLAHPVVRSWLSLSRAGPVGLGAASLVRVRATAQDGPVEAG